MENTYNSFEDLKELSDQNKKNEEAGRAVPGLVSRDLYSVIGKDKFGNKSRLSPEELSKLEVQTYVPNQGYKINYEPMLLCKKTIEKRFQDRFNKKYEHDFGIFQKFQDELISMYDAKKSEMDFVIPKVESQPKVASDEKVYVSVVSEPVKEKIQVNYVAPVETPGDSETVSVGRSIEDIVFDTPKVDVETFLAMPKVKVLDYFKLNLRVKMLYQIGRDIVPRKSKLTQEKREKIFNSNIEAIDKSKELATKYSTIFRSYSKALEVVKLKAHAVKEEAEFELFMKEETLNDLAEDYSPSFVKDVAIDVARDSVKEQRLVAEEDKSVFDYFVSKKSKVDKKIRKMDAVNQKLDFTKKGFEEFLAA